MSGLAWAGWCLLGLVAGLLAVLAVPVDLEFTLRRRAGRRTVACTLGWLFGVVRLPLPPSAGPKRERTKAREDGAARGAAAGRVMAALRTEGLGGRLLRLVRGLLRRVRIRAFSLDIRLGLDDPADTGRLWGMLAPLAVALAGNAGSRVVIGPDFTAQVFEVEGQGQVRVIPIRWLMPLLVFLLSPPVLRALRTLRA